ncbi:double homeobox protein 4-like protein 4 [Moschus berezovskii]|uniref:double homeobox protein 4-like protein 4 n=1 Tax=Moschus berezovskii TaxID=68408 RepID=UPI0024443456|nr:double homeobox protein 4-like protein 4 [Moschus berezovskii]
MASSGSSSTSTGPIATGSRRRRLVLKVSQKDALQALFQHNPYPGIATRERLARELGIAESRVQVWFQNQRRGRLKQSRSLSANVQQDGKGATAHAHTTIRTFSTSVFLPRAKVSSAENGPAEVALGLPDQKMGDMVSKPKSSSPPAERRGAWQRPGPRPRRRIGHNYSCSRGPKGPARCPEHLSSPSPLSSTGGHAALGCSRSFGRPHLLGARDCLWGLCGPALDDLHGPAQPGGSQAKWEACTSSRESSSLGRILPCCHGPMAAWVKGHPATSFQARQASYMSSCRHGRPGHAGAFAEGRLRCRRAARTRRRLLRGPLRMQERTLPSQAHSSFLDELWAPMDAGGHPALPGAPSFLDDLLETSGILEAQATYPGAAADAGEHPALPGPPSFLEELMAASGIPDTMGPSLGPSADARAHVRLPGSPSLQDELLAATCIPGSPSPSPGSSPVTAGDHPALPVSPSLLEEIMAATAIQDTPWVSQGSAAEEEGVEAILEAPLSEDDYQALLDMLPGSPGPRP